MRDSKVLRKLRSGQVARICVTGSPIAFYPAVAAHNHFDGIWVDGEHRTWDPAQVNAMLAQHYAADIDAVWRSPSKEKNALYRLLEDGATGLMIPHVSSAAEALQLVQAIKFPPMGDRGFCGGGRDARYWIGKPADYIQKANEETFLVVQIETPSALDNVDEIAAVPGVEVLFLGPGDMSLRLGCTPAVDDPVMLEVQKKVAAAAAKHGKAWGRPVGSKADAARIIELGARFVAYGGEFAAVCALLEQCDKDFDSILAENSSASSGEKKLY
jgi:4-hydroxy-2-oxoheptanedioate aldolase